MRCIFNHVFKLIVTDLIELLLDEFFFLEPLDRLELFYHLLTCFTRQVSILEILHGGLIHMHITKAICEFGALLLFHQVLSLAMSVAPPADILHFNLLLVWAILIGRWLIWALETHSSFSKRLLKLHLLLALSHNIIGDTSANHGDKRDRED